MEVAYAHKHANKANGIYVKGYSSYSLQEDVMCMCMCMCSSSYRAEPLGLRPSSMSCTCMYMYTNKYAIGHFNMQCFEKTAHLHGTIILYMYIYKHYMYIYNKIKGGSFDIAKNKQ